MCSSTDPAGAGLLAHSPVFTSYSLEEEDASAREAP